MQKRTSLRQSLVLEQQKKRDQQRQELVVQAIKLANGATLTRLRPVGNA